MKKKKREFKRTKKFSKIALTSVILFSLALFILDLNLFLAILFSILLLEAYIVWREKVGREVLLALLFALIITSYYNYQYTTFNIFIGKINLFPLISWTFGLVFLREIHQRINVKNKILITTIIYWALLLSLEYIFYRFLNIRLSSNYAGLFGLDLMHAEGGMKFFYILAGPVYLLIAKYLRLK